MTPCEYGPMADGALSVVIFFNGIDAPYGCAADANAGDRECYSLGGFEGQTEEAVGVCGGHSPQLLGIAIARRGELGESVDDPPWLVSFAAERHRRKVRRVGLDEQTVLRNQPQQIVVAPLFERDDSAE